MSFRNFEMLLRRLERVAGLWPGQRQAVLDLPVTLKEFLPRSDIASHGDISTQCCVLVRGVACRNITFPDGRRQILSFHIAGDIPDLQTLHLPRMDHNIATIERSLIAFISHDAIRKLMAQEPEMGRILWRDTLVDASIFRTWIVNVGQRRAAARFAHLFCELAMKHESVGLGDRSGFPMSLTQMDLADATGVTAVHANRTMQALRRNGLIATHDGQLVIPDWRRLAGEAEFDPAYLYLDRRPPEDAELLASAG